MATLQGQVLPFIHPGLAAAALAAGLLPLLIHWLNRRRFVRMPWAAMAFLLSANRRSVRRLRLEQILLLLTRIGLVVGFGLAVARPYLSAGPLFPGVSSRVHRVILLDDSLSMSARTADGGTRFTTAKLYAQGLIDSFPATDAVSLITLAAPATAVLDMPVYDRRFVRDQLRGVEVTERGTDFVGGFQKAAEVSAKFEGPAANRAVYLISDLPIASWRPSPAGDAEADTAWRRLAGLFPRPTESMFILPVAAETPANLAVTRIAAETSLTGVGVPVRIATEATNFGTAPARGVVLQVRRDGQIIRRQQLPRLEPGATVATIVTTEFQSAGTHLLEAKLTGPAPDALQEDDIRFLSVEVREAMGVVVVDGRPGATQLAGQSGFLVAALAPGEQAIGRALLRPTVISDSELSPGAFLDAEVVALCNVSRLSPDVWRSLEEFVTAGGGLFVLGGDLVHADQYNRFGFRDGRGLLPFTFRDNEKPSEAGPSVGFQPEGLSHAIVADFAAQPESGLFTARVERYLPVELAPGRAEIVLRFTNGDPAMIASTFGRGRVLVFTTSADMNWTNLPARGDYVSLMVNSLAYLLPKRGEHRNVMVGTQIRERLSAAQSSLPLRVSAGGVAAAEPSLVPDDGGLALAYGPVEEAGVVTVLIGAESRAFTANVDVAESDLASVDAVALQTRFRDVAQVVTDAKSVWERPAVAQASELATTAMFIVLVLLFVEMWMAARFGSRGGGAARDRSVPGAARRAAHGEPVRSDS